MEEQKSGGGGEIQFDTVEYTEGPPPFACASCARPVAGEYYEAGGKFICPNCRDEMSSTAGGAQNLLRAAGLGTIAALIGGAIWFGVRRLTGYEIGLIAIVVGLMVGVAVRMGAKGRGGPRYQALAVFLTYTGIAMNYAPDIFSAVVAGARESSDAPAASASATPDVGSHSPANDSQQTPPAQEMGAGGAIVGLTMLAVVVIGLSYAAPFLGGLENILGLLIIGFALFEAWRINRQVPIQGPFRTAANPPAQEGVG